ncbi:MULTISPECIES: urea transporter [unclassified Sporosarcina]|uniref:urea transporter n=1 Tax=unclassified Sporosarcina TaxID=2647733 RepID=UPI000C16E3DC|nr:MULTISPECIES: urea transporter [unclassified Sporosarcina]PIC99569.1 urea transporter [Sporosarcina sp. P29]PID06451.1 urea transporter [Sporosarcina sp. P30]PID09645.1 urea transporter [Sporosarcina sp. P31]PID13223.1 urea transporter [Sporosarcina sp. P32b]
MGAEKRANQKMQMIKEGSFTTFLKESIKGISQIIYIENTITGLLILLAITVSSLSLGIIALLSAMIGTLVAKIGGADQTLVSKGLMSYNSVLTGLVLQTFLTGPTAWIVALVGAAVTAIFTATLMYFLGRLGIPILTLPFILFTWFTLLASYKLDSIKLSDSLSPQSLANWELHIEGKINLLQATFNGIGQIFFLTDTLPGLLLFIAVFWASRKMGIYAVIGNVVACVTALALAGEHTLIMLGLYGYNAILTILAVTVVYNTKENRYAPITGVVAACITVPLMASVSIWLLPLGLPALTMPFVLSTWLILGARKVLPNL